MWCENNDEPIHSENAVILVNEVNDNDSSNFLGKSVHQVSTEIRNNMKFG